MNIIGINGFKRSGKGEAALAIERLLPELNVHSVGFADKLKILAAKTLGFSDLTDAECIALMDEAKESWIIDIYNDRPVFPEEAPDWEITGRQYLQNLGNQAREVFGEGFWVDQVLPVVWADGTIEGRLNRRYPTVDVLCITDVRYPNEAQRVRDLGGAVWEVVRPGVESDGHASEQRLPRELVDWQITNDKGLDALEWRVDEALLETVR